MNPVELTLENLKQLDFGKIIAAFDHEREHVVKDCLDRPQDPKPREVCIRFIFKPVSDETSRTIDCDSIDVGCEVSSKVPKRRTAIYSMKPKNSGELTFHPDLPSDAEGSTLYDPDNVDKATGEEK